MPLSSRPFLKPRFCGPRFETNAMPVDVLPELLAYRDLVLTVAKELWRRNHPEKSRLPKHFEERFQLEVRQVEGGSAIPVLERVYASLPMELPLDEFDQARDLVEQAVEAVGSGKPLPDVFPPGAIPQFGMLGRRLRPDEYVMLNRPGAASGPRYDRAIRSNLLLSIASTYVDDVELIAEVSSLEANQPKIYAQLEDGRRLFLPYELSSDELTAIKEQIPGTIPLAITGSGLFNRDKKLERLDTVEQLTILEPGRERALFEESLAMLEGLAEGWSEGEGRPYAAEDLRWTRRYFLALALKRGIRLPILYPVTPRVLRAEWRQRPIDLSAEIDLASKSAYLHALDLTTDKSSERELNAERDLEEVVGFIEAQLPQES